MKRCIKIGDTELESYRAYYSKLHAIIKNQTDTGYTSINMIELFNNNQKMKDRVIESLDGSMVMFLLEIAKTINIE